MVPLIIYEQKIIIPIGNKVYFIDSNSGNIIRNIEIDFTSIEKSPEENANQQDKVVDSKNPCTIQHLDISPNHQYLAVTTSGKKCLILYRITSENIEHLSTRSISRASSAITFSNDSNNLLLCDKSGDCYLFDCNDYMKPGKWILGHLSIVLDVIFTPDQKYIITCDRDEKIRVTNFPNCYEIHIYCLGHEEFVSQIDLLTDEHLLSISGDKTLKIWNYHNGKKIFNYDLPAPAFRSAIRTIRKNIYHVAIVLHETENTVIILELSKFDNDSFNAKVLSKHNFTKTKNIVNLKFNNNELYLLSVEENYHLGLEILSYDEKDCQYFEVQESALKNKLNDYFKEYQIPNLEDFSLWFKKKFDNVSEYLERKKRRIEEKNSR